MASDDAPEGFDRFRKPRSRPPARTPEAALLGLLDGAAGPEDLYEAVGRVRPLVSRPQDPADLDRALARWSPDHGPGALGEAFRGLLGSPDQETALHAAESLSVMEVRYSTQIERSRAEGNRSRRAFLYAGLADLAGRDGALRIFYLKEAFAALQELSADKALKKDDILLAARIQVSLGRSPAAARLVEKALGSLPGDTTLLEVLADLRFRARDYAGLGKVVAGLERDGSLGMSRLAPAARRWQ